MKKKMIAILIAQLMCISALIGCSPNAGTTTALAAESRITVEAADKETIGKVDTYITLDNENVTVDGKGAEISDGKLVISRGGTYSISGTLTDGQIVVNTSNEEKVYLILNDADITCLNSAAIYVKQADKTVIYLAEGTENKISDGKEYTFESENSDEPYAAVYSKDDLTIMGEGSLIVNGNYKEGITGKDDLQIDSGNITVNSVDDGIKGRDSLIVTGGNITVNSGKDGLKSNFDEEVQENEHEKGYVYIEGGTISITSEGDGIQGENNVYIKDGKINIKSGGGSDNAQAHTEGMMPGGMGRPNDKNGAVFGENPGMIPPSDKNNVTAKQIQTASSAEEKIPPTLEDSDETTNSDESDSSKGIKAGVKIVIEGSDINVDSSDDAIHANDGIIISAGDIKIEAGDDGIHGDNTLDIYGGNINVEKSYEGLEAETITVEDGKIYITSSDDGVNASPKNEISKEGNMMLRGGNGAPPPILENNAEANTDTTENVHNTDLHSQQANTMKEQNMQNDGGGAERIMSEYSTGVLNINGGYLVVNADGDGLDSNGAIKITGGTVLVYGPTNNGNGALDYDTTFEVSGGTFAAIGSSGMAQAASDSSSQNCISLTLSEQEAEFIVRIEDENGNEIVTIAPLKKYSSVVISSPDLKSGSTYKVFTGGSVNGGKVTDGIYEGGTYTKGTEALSFTISEVITNAVQEGAAVSSGNGVGQMGGRRGGIGRRMQTAIQTDDNVS